MAFSLALVVRSWPLRRLQWLSIMFSASWRSAGCGAFVAPAMRSLSLRPMNGQRDLFSASAVLLRVAKVRLHHSVRGAFSDSVVSALSLVVRSLSPAHYFCHVFFPF